MLKSTKRHQSGWKWGNNTVVSPAGGLTAGLFSHFLPAAIRRVGGPSRKLCEGAMCTCLFTNIKNTSKTVTRPIRVPEWGNLGHRSPDDWGGDDSMFLKTPHVRIFQICWVIQRLLSKCLHEVKPLYYPFLPLRSLPNPRCYCATYSAGVWRLIKWMELLLFTSTKPI